MRKLSVVIAVAAFIFSCSKPEDFIFPEDGIINNQDGKLSALKAVGQYNGESTCTGVFVKISDNLDAPAYVLTNGHCVQDWSSTDVNINVPATNHSITFNVFENTPSVEKVKVSVKQVSYSTMKGTDIGIVELNTTVRELMNKGINPLPLAKQLPITGTPIKVYGIPVNEIEPNQQFLRQSSCVQGKKTDLIEFTWTWWDMYANQCGNIKGGSSGSPVISSLNDGVFGLINTTTIDAGSPCYLGAPCESSTQGVSFSENTSYMLPVVGVQGCFTSSGKFDINAPDCKLDKGKQVKLAGSPIGSINPSANEIGGRPANKLWNYTVSEMTHYRYKIGQMGVSNPRDLTGFSEVISTAVKPIINDSLPTKAGHYYLSVIGGNSPSFDANWQQATYATIIRIEIDKSMPTKEPVVIINDFGDNYSVALYFSPPELSNYIYKIGKPDITDANDPKGYVTYRRIPINIDKKNLPLKVCVIGYDAAGNATKPYEKIIDK